VHAADSVRVRVPATSANLGPGFDCFAAALGLHLELEVGSADRFELVTDLDVRRDRSNLAVAAFERIHPSDGLRFVMRSQIPLSGGLGSSAAAIVAGLLAANHLCGAGADPLALATQIEGHPDNVAAALLGGVVVCAPGVAPHAFPAPAGLAALLVIPRESVRTARARAALPRSVPMGDAVANVASGALLMLGLARGDLELVSRGLRDRLHQPYRAHLYPRSAALLEQAPALGALGATISGAGPTVLVWVAAEQSELVAQGLREHAEGWADVRAAPFAGGGAEIVSGG
jgi:homoserine kinase